MKKIAIFGAGGFGREVKMLIDQINQDRHQFELIGFFDDDESKSSMVNGLPILGGIKELNQWQGEIGVVFSVGNPLVKRNIIEKVTNHGVFYPSLIHPSVIIGSDGVNIGEGVIICAGCILTVNIDIEDHVILNLCCTVGHDTKLGKYSAVMPSVNISGEVELGEGVYVGTGTKINNQVKLGEYSIIGSGAVVAKDIPAKCTAVGIPAKPIKFH